MKLADVKDKIDAYFNTVNPKEIILYFEALGYEFEPVTEVPLSEYALNVNNNLNLDSFFTENTNFLSADIDAQFKEIKQILFIKIVSIKSNLKVDFYLTSDSDFIYSIAA